MPLLGGSECWHVALDFSPLVGLTAPCCGTTLVHSCLVMDNDEEAVSINERKRKLNFFCFSEFIVRQHPPLHAIFSFDAVCD